MKQPVKICLTALKGGAGKSTLTFQCATALAARGKRVLVIDVDPQSNTTLKMSELPINERYEHSVANIYNGDFTVRPQISNYENIDIIPASIYLQLTAEEIVSKPAREKIMYNYLKSSDWIAEYDYIFFDTAPAMNTINQNAFYCADHIFLVAEPDSFSVSGVILFSDKWSLVANALEIEKQLNCNTYFCDPYCAWQKGTNENTNGLLREFYPKGMDLSFVRETELKSILFNLNSRPRKCLNYTTPHEELFNTYT